MTSRQPPNTSTLASSVHGISAPSTAPRHGGKCARSTTPHTTASASHKLTRAHMPERRRQQRHWSPREYIQVWVRGKRLFSPVAPSLMVSDSATFFPVVFSAHGRSRADTFTSHSQDARDQRVSSFRRAIKWHRREAGESTD